MACFSPETLEYYTRSEYTILGGEIPLWRSFAQPSRREVIDVAVKNGWIEPVTTGEPRWDLVYHANAAWKDGHGPLYELLSRSDEAILEKSLSDPDWARVYWGEVFGALRSPNPVERDVGGHISQYWRCETADELRRQIAGVRGEFGLSPSAINQ